MNDRGNGAAEPDPERAGEDGLGELLAAVARGERAFDHLYEQLSGPVSRAVRSILHDPAQAEEVVQEVLLEVWRTASRYDAKRGSVRTWALTMARRRAIDRVRADAARSSRELRVPPGPASWDHVGDDVLGTLEVELLGRSLEKLSYPQRQAIILAYYGRHTHAEVADLLGVPLGTVKTRIRNALIRLRGQMGEPSLPPARAVSPGSAAGAWRRSRAGWVIESANGAHYGLVAYFYTSDRRRQVRVSEALDFEMIGIDEYTELKYVRERGLA